MEGRSLVKLLCNSTQHPIAFVKFYPRYPLRQFVIDSFCRRLSGYSVITTLANFRFKGREYGYPVLLSKPIVGKVNQAPLERVTLLHYQLTGQERTFEKDLDTDAYFWKYLETLLLTYSDDKNDNLTRLPIPGCDRYRLISIDTDEGLENVLATEKG